MTALAIACFIEEDGWKRARSLAVEQDYRVVGQWCPYPPELPEKRDGMGSILIALIVGGLLGGVGLFMLAAWNSMLAYPFDSGGRALLSWQTFLVPAVEISALTAAVAGVACFFRAAGLTRLHHPAFDLAEVEVGSRDAFVLACTCDPGAPANQLLALFALAGASHSRLVEE